MAKVTAVWGIDIGQSALKALRCRPFEDATKIVADAFDYIEYPKILSQPDADAAELVNDALKQFLSRNSVRGDRVVISASGQSGLARFIKLPPVEAKKIPDIVKYEAKQQIPFDLDEVVWDFQQMAGGSTDEGFALETEVGLFAMKRDQAYKVLQPFDRVDVEVDLIQLTPLALYNYIVYDQMQNLPPADEYDAENPPDSVVVISLGTETTDLVVTNGFRVWQRSIPIGGNHFTKALTKELKLNFATAEHLKRNASQAEDPKALFQAMRPVFNDLLTEIQRSMNFFKNMDRKANISRAVALGNVMKLPGLQRYLAQNLGYELAKVDSFRGLTGDDIVSAPAFKENLLAYGVCYGLCLQGLKHAKIDTNLLPREIMQFRMIRAKKPWAVAAAAALLVGCGISFIRWHQAADSVSLAPLPPNATSEQRENSFAVAKQAADGFIQEAGDWNQKYEEAKAVFTKTDEVGRSMLQNILGRDLWARFLKTVNYCLPDNVGERPKDIAARNEIKVDGLECRWVEKLEDWYAANSKNEETPAAPKPAAPPAAPAGDQPAADQPVAPEPANPDGTPVVAAPVGPSGPGWVFKISGHHYHNADPSNQGIAYVRNTFLKNLKSDEVPIPLKERVAGGPKTYPIKKLGIAYPMMIGKPLIEDFPLPSEDEDDDRPPGLIQAQAAAQKFHAQARLNFEIEFCWQPKPVTEDEHIAVGPPVKQEAAAEPAAGAVPAPGATTQVSP